MTLLSWFTKLREVSWLIWTTFHHLFCLYNWSYKSYFWMARFILYLWIIILELTLLSTLQHWLGCQTWNWPFELKFVFTNFIVLNVESCYLYSIYSYKYQSVELLWLESWHLIPWCACQIISWLPLFIIYLSLTFQWGEEAANSGLLSLIVFIII